MADRTDTSRSTLAAVWPPTAATPAKAGHRQMSPMGAIRRKCLDCCCGQIIEVKLCEASAFPLWPFRARRHPYTKTRLLQADCAANDPSGSQLPEDASPSRTSLQQPSFSERGAILLDGKV